MNKFKILVVTCVLAISGCASSSDLEKRASYHAKSAAYYHSIGQPDAARDEFNKAKKNKEDANNIFSIFVDVFNLFNKKD